MHAHAHVHAHFNISSVLPPESVSSGEAKPFDWNDLKLARGFILETRQSLPFTGSTARGQVEGHGPGSQDGL